VGVGLGRGFLPSGWVVWVRGDFYFYFFHFWSASWACRSTNEYNIKILYVNYIIMKIYVLVYINIFLFSNFLCVIIMSHHIPIMNFTHINYVKTFEN
jgi:hypothetical protein